MKITWLDNTSGPDLHPTWEIEKARLHTVKNMQQPDGSSKDTIVLYFQVTEKQYKTLITEYGKENIPSSIIGLNVIPLFPDAVLWTWRAPKGYENSFKTATYTALEISP